MKRGRRKARETLLVGADRGPDGGDLQPGRNARDARPRRGPGEGARRMTAMDFIKAPIILFGYLILAPLLGFLIKESREGQRWVFGMMVFMTSWHINKFTLMLDSVEMYRGHTKGFEFSFIEILALALIVASAAGRPKKDPSPKALRWRWLPPGALLYLLYCAACWVSVFVAPNTLYGVMAGIRFTKAVIILIGAFQFVRDEGDIRFLLKAVAFTLGVQLLVVLKMKYVDHFYQIHGWFEHQNPLAMWAYLCGLPLLAAAMSDANKVETRWYSLGFAASAVIVQSSLSRGSLMFFAAGVAAVVLLSLADKLTAKRVLFILGMGFAGSLGLAVAAHSIIARFHDEGNEASGETRTVMNLASKAMLQHSAVGIGWNNFALTINHPYTYGDVIDEWEGDRGHTVNEDYAKGVVESHYWLILAETGYGGFFTYLLFIAAGMWWCFRGMSHWRGRFLGVYLGGLLVALLLTYVHSNLERVLTQTKNMSMWLIFLGSAARVETWRRAEKLS